MSTFTRVLRDEYSLLYHAVDVLGRNSLLVAGRLFGRSKLFINFALLLAAILGSLASARWSGKIFTGTFFSQ